MNTPQDKGGTAFPTTQKNFAPEEVDFGSPGMTLRDWFAGMALQGAIACPASSGKFADFASDSYQYADAMLAARKEQP